MKLEWMGKNRSLVEKVIRYGNRYATTYKTRYIIYKDVELCNAEVQVLEYLIENEELKLNMADTAQRLGVSASSFTKVVSKLSKMGLLEKFHKDNNKKDVIVMASDFGKTVYDEYVKGFTDWINTIDEMLKDIPKDYITQFTDVIDYASRIGEKNEKYSGSGREPRLIPINSSN